MEYSARLVVFSLLLLYIPKYLTAVGCGKPGHSRKSSPIYFENDGVYADGSYIAYGCDYILIGGETRTCENGHWSKPIPKCPDLLNATGLTVKAGADKTIYISWADKIRVVGLQVAMRRPSYWALWQDVKIDGADDMGGTWSMTKYGKDDNIRFIQIAISTTDVRFYPMSDRIVLRTDTQFADCAVNAQGDFVQLNNSNIQGQYLCLNEDLHELYYVDDSVDACDTPDTPVNAQVTSTFTSEDILNSSYACNEGYRLKESQIGKSPICPKNGDWSAYDYQPCEEIVCDKDSAEYAIASVNYQNVDGSAVPIGTKGFLACSTVEDKRYVVCTKDGAWAPMTALCDSPAGGPDNLMAGLAVGLVVALMLLAALGGFLVYRQCQRVPRDVNLNMKSMKSHDGHTGAENSYDYLDYAESHTPHYDALDYEAEVNTLPTASGVRANYLEVL